ncbi:MAG: MFS transporter [Deltaproteobacteria bacterium]|nr:MFS transporter [Deltaproteobacteria bacterium]
MSTADSPPPGAGKLPPQIPYIIGNEACERFSFYGMRNILTDFLTKSAILVAVAETDRGQAAKEIFHIFVMGVYFFPLLGGWLSDRFWGKYKTIFWLSLVYCAGNACLAFFVDDKFGFYAGLLLISIGSGGIKPCVSAFVGEQFDQSNKHLAKLVFDAFYWIINFGSFFASWLIPLTLISWGPRWAFGIPGILMFVATFIFWLGRKRYVVEPPRPNDPNAFSAICVAALGAGSTGARVILGIGLLATAALLPLGGVDFWRMLVDIEPYLGTVQSWCLALVVFLGFGGVAVWLSLERVRGKFPDEEIDGVRAVLRVLVLFVPVTAFWSLFDQKASTWVLQGKQMLLPVWDLPSWAPAFLQLKNASQMQSLNPLLVMALIPFNNAVLYPLLRKLGVEPTALRRMTAGIALAGLAWIGAGLLQLRIDGGAQLSILWQVGPYVLLTLGEVLLSATGLEFAYSQAPAKLKGVIMSFWTLAVTIGGLWVLLVNKTVKGESATKAIEGAGIGVTSFQMFFFAAFAFAAALAFGAYAQRYRVVDHYRKA